MGKIVPGKHLLGVSHWYIWYPHLKKRDVYKYYGKSDSCYWFTKKEDNVLVGWTPKQIALMIKKRELRCFCFDTERLGKLSELDLAPNVKQALQDILK